MPSIFSGHIASYHGIRAFDLRHIRGKVSGFDGCNKGCSRNGYECVRPMGNSEGLRFPLKLGLKLLFDLDSHFHSVFHRYGAQ